MSKPCDMSKTQSDGSTASYYELPDGATELQHLISHRDMNAQIGEIFRACYRDIEVSDSARASQIAYLCACSSAVGRTNAGMV